MNRFLLCRIVAKGARALHTPDKRIQDSMRWALKITVDSSRKRGHTDINQV